MITINPIREFEFRNRIIIPFRSLDSWIRMICFILLDVHLFFFFFFVSNIVESTVSPRPPSSSIVNRITNNNRPKGRMKILSFFYLIFLPSFIMRNSRFRVIFHHLKTNSIPSFMSRWMVVRDFFFFFSIRVRVAKTRNFVKYHYFETVHPLKTSRQQWSKTRGFSLSTQ